jgi:hypothetical protein
MTTKAKAKAKSKGNGNGNGRTKGAGKIARKAMHRRSSIAIRTRGAARRDEGKDFPPGAVSCKILAARKT